MSVLGETIMRYLSILLLFPLAMLCQEPPDIPYDPSTGLSIQQNQLDTATGFEIGLIPRGSTNVIMFNSVSKYMDGVTILTSSDIASFKLMCASSLEDCNRLWDEGSSIYISTMESEANTYLKYWELGLQYNDLVRKYNSLLGNYNTVATDWNNLSAKIKSYQIPKPPAWWRRVLGGVAIGLQEFGRQRTLNCTARSVNLGFVTRTTMTCN